MSHRCYVLSPLAFIIFSTVYKKTGAQFYNKFSLKNYCPDHPCDVPPISMDIAPAEHTFGFLDGAIVPRCSRMSRSTTSGYTMLGCDLGNSAHNHCTSGCLIAHMVDTVEEKE